jgi:acetylornithine deacetylase
MPQPSLAPALDILERLVAVDTHSSESNLPLIEYVRGVLRGHGIEASMVYRCQPHQGESVRDVGPLQLARRLRRATAEPFCNLR